jgi:hypothetical protein
VWYETVASVVAHIVGIPIEETVLGFAPMVGLGLGYILKTALR